MKSYTRSNQSLELSQTIEVRSRVESKFESSHTHGQVRLKVNSALLQQPVGSLTFKKRIFLLNLAKLEICHTSDISPYLILP